MMAEGEVLEEVLPQLLALVLVVIQFAEDWASHTVVGVKVHQLLHQQETFPLCIIHIVSCIK